MEYQNRPAVIILLLTVAVSASILTAKQKQPVWEYSPNAEMKTGLTVYSAPTCNRIPAKTLNIELASLSSEWRTNIRLDCKTALDIPLLPGAYGLHLWHNNPNAMPPYSFLNIGEISLTNTVPSGKILTLRYAIPRMAYDPGIVTWETNSR